MDILDNQNLFTEKDPSDALGIIGAQYQQLTFDARVQNPENDSRVITSIVVAGMGGSALAALVAKVLLTKQLAVPFEIVRGYDLPAYINESTLVIASSYSGNTEETLSSLEQATASGAQLAILASGGKLVEIAQERDITYVTLPGGAQPRMAAISNLRALFELFKHFGITDESWINELHELSGWLKEQSEAWAPGVPTADNYAKQLAVKSVGKIQMFYGGQLTAPLAYKWKISFNETAKNVAFWNEFPEFNHNEFMGWTEFPIEKPFAVFDLVSSLEHPRVLQRFELSDRLLSGKRPQAQPIQLQGDTLLAQLLWGSILADYTSTYTAILNNVDPTPVALIERLKQELADNPR